MRTIWKFPFHIDGTVSLRMPEGAVVVHVDVQNGQPTLWALVDENAATEVREFHIFGTGHKVPDGVGLNHHVGSFQLLDGVFVGHMFEVPR